MALPTTPVVKKFFTNKIESSTADWGELLLEIVHIYSMFDGEEYDRSSLTDQFSTISGRSPYALRDQSNYRDEFGAYGPYLGLFHIQKENNIWRLYLSKAARHFLCSTEPNVEAFCRTQLALFQYPNGAGAVAGQTRVATNALNDTVREIQNNIRINPLRLLCRVVITLHELCGIALEDITIPYKTIFMLFNDSTVNQTFSPSYESIRDAIDSYNTTAAPSWVAEGLGKFKRNFHVFERIGMFKSVRNGLALLDTDKAYSYIKSIGEINTNFTEFESCYGAPDIPVAVKQVVLSSGWGRYYDSLIIPTDTLVLLSDEIDIDYTSMPTTGTGITTTPGTAEQDFPGLHEFHSSQIRAFAPSGRQTNPMETIIRREKANREHARILTMLAAKLRANGYDPYENVFIDLYAEICNETYIFEVKSNNANNALSQIRKAVSQLYEYRYRSEKSGAKLCIVLQEKPVQTWLENYLLQDRNIMVCWLVDEVRLECPAACHQQLADIGIVD